MNAQETPDWLAEGAAIAVIHTGCISGEVKTVRRTIQSLDGEVVTLETGETFSALTLDRISDTQYQYATFARLADLASPEMIREFARQDQDAQHARMRDAYVRFHCGRTDENAAQLIAETEAFRALLAAANPGPTLTTVPDLPAEAA